MFGVEVDMWSIGCILAELYTGTPLFYGPNLESILMKASNSHLLLEKESCISLFVNKLLPLYILFQIKKSLKVVRYTDEIMNFLILAYSAFCFW